MTARLRPWTTIAAAALFALSAALLGFGHAPVAAAGPVVLGPDGAPAVLCLASAQDEAPAVHDARCDACTLVAAAAPPPPVVMLLAPPRVEAQRPAQGPPAIPSALWRPAAARAPPVALA